jgi:hypothetical protein
MNEQSAADLRISVIPVPLGWSWPQGIVCVGANPQTNLSKWTETVPRGTKSLGDVFSLDVLLAAYRVDPLRGASGI